MLAAGCAAHPAPVHANAAQGVYVSPRYNRTFQFARLDVAGTFTLTTVSFRPCRDVRAAHPGFVYDEESGAARRFGNGIAVDTDRGDKLVLDLGDDRIVMHDAEGVVTLRRIAGRELDATAERYRRAVVDRPEARC
ncbi:MAG: hypothetical protein ABR591_05260 [Candidatus Velthaea sp.]